MPDGLMGKVRINRTSPVSQQSRKVMDFPRLSRFQNNRDRRPLLRPHQMLLQPRHRQQGRHSHMVLVHAPVRKNQYVSPLPDGTVHFDKQIFNRLLKP